MKSFRAIAVVLALACGGAGAGVLAGGGDPADAARKKRLRAQIVKGKARAHVPARMLRPTRTWSAPQNGGSGSGGGGQPAETTPPPQTTTQPPRECPRAIGVDLDDQPWFVRPTRTDLCAGGTVTVEARNIGEDDHDLRIVRLGEGGGFTPVQWPVMNPGAREPREVTFPAGRFYLYCTVGDHETRGMSANVEAT